MGMNIQIRDYEVDSVILYLGSDVNILMKQTCERMGIPWLVWSLVQLWLANQARVTSIGWVRCLSMEVEGMKNYVDFDVIDVVYGRGSYLVLLGFVWANEILEVINFKKRMMTFENQEIRVIAPMDPT